MKKMQAFAVGLTILLHAGALLFGGLLLFRHNKAKTAEDQNVEIVAPDEEKAPEQEKAKEVEERKEAPPEDTPPELAEQNAAPLDLAQLEMALDPGQGGGAGGDFASRGRALGAASMAQGKVGADSAVGEVFSIADLDQVPRATSQPAPAYPPELRKKKMAGTVYVLFLVDKSGRVVSPIVQRSSNAVFEQPAIQAVKSWRFEPGKRAGQTVQFKMRVPITFAAG